MLRNCGFVLCCCVAVACGGAVDGADSSGVGSTSSPLAAEKVEICHRSYDGSHTISVSQNAVPAHLAHGDHVVAAEVCGDDVDNDCDGAVDEDCGPAGDCTLYSRNGSSYWFCREFVDWFTAAGQCASGGVSLATVNDADENAFLVNTAIAEGLNFAGFETGWIGGNDLATEDDWTWQSGAPWAFTQWNPGEPNNLGNEDCLVLWIFDTWNDWRCDLQTGFICESP